MFRNRTVVPAFQKGIRSSKRYWECILHGTLLPETIETREHRA
jgi:hypothetical protein